MTDLKKTVETKEFLAQRKMAYVQTFNKESKSVETVLEDLARFCRAHESTFHTDERMHAVLEGRREVWLRIQNHLELSDKELWMLFVR